MNPTNKLEAPYPHIASGDSNPFYISILQNLYSGRGSELTAILQYVYQTHYFEAISEETAKTILDMAIVEMEHLEQLAKAIKAFGGDPRYVSAKGMAFSTKCVDYSKDYVSMLLADIMAEKSAIKAYGDAANMVKDEGLKALFLRIQADEQLHYKIYEKLLMEAKSMMI